MKGGKLARVMPGAQKKRERRTLLDMKSMCQRYSRAREQLEREREQR